MWVAGCGSRDVGRGMRGVVGCASRDVDRGMWVVGCWLCFVSRGSWMAGHLVHCSRLTINRDVLPLDGLDDEVAHHAPIVRVHARAEGVEDAGNAHFRLPLYRADREEVYRAGGIRIRIRSNSSRSGSNSRSRSPRRSRRRRRRRTRSSSSSSSSSRRSVETLNIDKKMYTSATQMR